MELKFMRAAFKEACAADKADEVPIGAVIVLDGKVIARGQNRTERKQSAVAHAETEAIQKACKKLGSWRLDGAEMYVTVEPCAMCAGAIAGARIKKVYFGAHEKKSGCAESLYPVLTINGLNHTTEFIGGVMEDDCAALIKNFFRRKRTGKKTKAF